MQKHEMFNFRHIFLADSFPIHYNYSLVLKDKACTIFVKIEYFVGETRVISPGNMFRRWYIETVWCPDNVPHTLSDITTRSKGI